MQITAGRLWEGADPGRYVAARHIGPAIAPSLIVIHDTAGALRPGSTVEWLQRPTSTVSAHFVVERDGQVTQMVPTDRMAYHCGQSAWRGRTGLNGHAIGIEIVNPGKLIGRRAGEAVASFGAVFTVERDGIEEAATADHGAGWWLPYTPDQIAAVTALCRAIVAAHPKAAEIVGHYQISPGRKIDPSPLFPLEELRATVLGSRRAPAPSDFVAEAQKKLAELGYPAGKADGDLGARTTGAIASFQAVNGLSVNGKLDVPTAEVLASSEAKPLPTGARAETTADELRDKGSRTIRLWDRIQALGRWLLGGGTALGLTEASGASLLDAAAQALGQMRTLMGGSLAGLSGKHVALALAVLLGLVLLRTGEKGTEVRVDDARKGKVA